MKKEFEEAIYRLCIREYGYERKTARKIVEWEEENLSRVWSCESDRIDRIENIRTKLSKQGLGRERPDIEFLMQVEEVIREFPVTDYLSDRKEKIYNNQ